MSYDETAMREHEVLLNCCRAAETLEEQKQCFDDLAEFLESTETRHQNNKNEDNLNVDALVTRETIARSLLTTWPYSQVSAGIDRALDACGPMISVSTCSGLLKEIAAASDSKHMNSKEKLVVWTPQTSVLPLRSIVQACWATIQRILLAATGTPPKEMKHDNNEQERLEMQQFVSKIILLLPQTLANACFAVKLQVPLHATPTYFFPRLIYFSWVQLQSTKDWNDMNDDKSITFSALYAVVLIGQFLQSRRSDHVAKGLMQRFGETSNTSSLYDDDKNGGSSVDTESASLSSFLISLELRARDMASFILAMLQYASSPEYKASISSGNKLWFGNSSCGALVVCNLLFHSSSIEYQEMIAEQLIFSNKASSCQSGNALNEKEQRRWSRWVAQTIAPSPLQKNHTCMSSFSGRLTNIANRWSRLTFVQDVGGRLQHHVSLVLWYGLKILAKASVSLQDPDQRLLTGGIVEGVSHRLGSILPIVRQDGMRIAQQLSKGLGQDGVLFDEFGEDDSESEGTMDESNNNDEKPHKKIEMIGKGDKRQSNHGFLDPDEDYDSDFEEYYLLDSQRESANTNSENKNGNDDASKLDDASVEWKDEFIPYDLEDDEEDLRTTQKPLHLLEALDLLRTGENHDHGFTRHEAALEALPSLIRNRPDDLADVAVSLASELLRMEDKFNIKDFGLKRESAIRSLLVEESLAVGQSLIEQLFEEGGLADRLLIISTLQGASLELSGNQALFDASIDPTLSKKRNLLTGQQDTEKAILSESHQVFRVLSKSRRKRSRIQPKTIKNQFSNTAPMWFYSLIAGFIKHRDDDVLWTGSTGSIFLAYFFRCLATIVEFSGPQASQVLANDLLELVWEFRTADVPEVRLSALIAVSTSIAMLSNERLISLLLDKDNLSRTMLEMSRTDPDKECRSLCQSISVSIHEVLKYGSF